MRENTGDPIFAARVKEEREKKGLSQSKLAEKAGISLTMVQKIENAERYGSHDTHKKLAEALGITLSELLQQPTTDKTKSRIPDLEPDPPLEPELQAILDDPELAIYFSRSSFGAKLSNRQKRQIALNIKMMYEENEERERDARRGRK